MSRFASDEYEEWFPNQGELWWASTRRALNSPRGQQTLLDMYHAIKALPEPKLAGGALATPDGLVCAVGALVLARRTAAGEPKQAVLDELVRLSGTPYCTCHHAHDQHVPGLVCTGCVRNATWHHERGRPTYEKFKPCTEFVFDYLDHEEGGHTTAELGAQVGMAYTLAWRLGALNDETYGNLTPEERYTAVLEWIEGQLLPVPV